jgi:hypothetical protein
MVTVTEAWADCRSGVRAALVSWEPEETGRQLAEQLSPQQKVDHQLAKQLSPQQVPSRMPPAWQSGLHIQE